MSPKNNSTTADRFPMWPALPTSEYYQSVWLPPDHQPLLTSSAWQVLQACAWTGWISLVPVDPFGCMLAVRTPGAPQAARVGAASDSAFPFER